MILVEIKNVSKIYQSRMALDDVSMTLESGKVYGILGPNGSGKTTLMKMLADLMQPTTGKILINGETPSVNSRQIVAYMPTSDHLYKGMSLERTGIFFKDFFDDFDMDSYMKLLEEMDLPKKLKVSALSSGMAAKLRVAATMARQAKLIMLDEPLNGIDLMTRDCIIKTIVNNIKEDTTLIISSHLVEQIEPILDEAILLKKGKVGYSGNVEQLREVEGMSVANKYREVFGA
ncbi:MAG: ABC transporter ATP-binding protein [Clostridia bacterium]|nr:ABC transporter ATP-binding protein [Clostridia bacterium]